MVYLMRIHPRYWIVFDNIETVDDKVWDEDCGVKLRTILLDGEVMDERILDDLTNTHLFYNNTPLVQNFPIYDICRDNLSESAANSSATLGIRYVCPPEVSKCGCTMVMK